MVHGSGIPHNCSKEKWNIMLFTAILARTIFLTYFIICAWQVVELYKYNDRWATWLVHLVMQLHIFKVYCLLGGTSRSTWAALRVLSHSLHSTWTRDQMDHYNEPITLVKCHSMHLVAWKASFSLKLDAYSNRQINMKVVNPSIINNFHLYVTIKIRLFLQPTSQP